jgi:hypothetical protein
MAGPLVRVSKDDLGAAKNLLAPVASSILYISNRAIEVSGNVHGAAHGYGFCELEAAGGYGEALIQDQG